MIRRALRAGFSLIEALVAMAVAALALAAILELQVLMVRGQQRAELALEHVAAQENALALVRDINPMARPEGEIRLDGGDVIRWRSTPRTDAVINTSATGGNGGYEVQLFTVTVEIERPDGRPPAPLTFDRMGWRRLSGVED